VPDSIFMQRGFRPVFHWAGSSLFAALIAISASAQPVENAAEIRIGLPPGAPPWVGLRPGADHIELDLPRGATFPQDFPASSGSLLREAKVTEGGQRVTLALDLALGALDQVIWEPGAVVLRFRSSVAPALESGDPEERYLLGPDDRIHISVHGHQELATDLAVSREGGITAPLVGEVRAAGLTPRQLAARLAELLGGAFLVNPQVDVRVEEYRSQWVVVSGEVRKPGRIALRGGTRLKEVMGQTEGFTDRAGESLTITRKLPGASGETKTLFVKREEFETGKSNPSLMSGDVIEVSLAEFCYIQGEVNRPNRFPVERGITLMRLITLAGGLTDWADRKGVRILYREGAVPRDRVFNLNDIERGKVVDPVLAGGEVIIVKKRFL
jgi:polysaccharide biosynthesis/export protein